MRRVGVVYSVRNSFFRCGVGLQERDDISVWIHRLIVRISPHARYRSWWSAQRTPLSAFGSRAVPYIDTTAAASLSLSILDIGVFSPIILGVATLSLNVLVVANTLRLVIP